jgi:hypothetical protein
LLAASTERDVVEGGGDTVPPTPAQLAVLEGCADDLLRARALVELVRDKGALLHDGGGGANSSVNGASCGLVGCECMRAGATRCTPDTRRARAHTHARTRTHARSHGYRRRA